MDPIYSTPAPLLDEQRDEILSQLSSHRHALHRVDLAGCYNDAAERETVVSPEVANVISSALVDDEGNLTDRHTIALDIDHPARLVPSSTPGHFHLYIDLELSWEAYEKLLSALAEAGVVQPGYVSMSQQRKATHLRLPWVRK